MLKSLQEERIKESEYLALLVFNLKISIETYTHTHTHLPKTCIEFNQINWKLSFWREFSNYHEFKLEHIVFPYRIVLCSQHRNISNLNNGHAWRVTKIESISLCVCLFVIFFCSHHLFESSMQNLSSIIHIESMWIVCGSTWNAEVNICNVTNAAAAAVAKLAEASRPLSLISVIRLART